MNHRKTNILIVILLFSLVILFLLAAGIQQLEFLPGEDFSIGNDMPVTSGAGDTILDDILILIIRGVTALAIVIFPIYLVYSLFTKEGRRWLLRNLIMFAIVITTLILFQEQLNNVSMKIMETLENMGALQVPETEPSGPEMTFDAEPPGWVSLAASLVIGLLTTAALGLGAWFIWKLRTRKPSELESLEDEARKAIDAIQAGDELELKDVILQCYLKMTEVVRMTRGIERDWAMPPDEFQRVLIQRGLPDTAVQQLTRLFEDVRYGGISFSDIENSQAVNCLNTIITACRTLRGEA